jgi:predicted phage terminase large subunit-like protein
MVFPVDFDSELRLGRGGEGLSYIDQDQLRRILANWKLTPATFAYKISRGHWVPSPHLQYIALRVAKAVVKGKARIILSMPPRHGKSQLVSIYTPAWLLEYIGRLNIILACYGSDLATGFVRQVRNIISDRNNHELLRVRLGDMKQAESFSTSLGGYMYGVGLGGTITGRGAHVLLIDDYIKEIKEALSQAHRDYVWNWYVTTALTRLEPGGSIIIIATRWHSDDLIGRLLAQEGDDWEYIELPALAVENDILGRPVGAPLFPERYPAQELVKLQRTLGSVFYQALYQQRPVDETVKITDPAWLKKWPRSRPLPRHMRLARIWDLAATEGGGDWLTGTLCGYSAEEDIFIVLDIFRAQLGPGDVEDAVLRIAQDDGYGTDIGIEQEPGAAGKILVEHYKVNVLGEYRVTSISTGGKAKVVRAQPFLAAAEAGVVYYLADDDSLPVERWWNQILLSEFTTFPSTTHATHDDTVDTAAEGYTHLTGKKPLSATWSSQQLGVVKGLPESPMRRPTQSVESLAIKSTQGGRKQLASISMAEHGKGGSASVRGATWGSLPKKPR